MRWFDGLMVYCIVYCLVCLYHTSWHHLTSWFLIVVQYVYRMLNTASPSFLRHSSEAPLASWEHTSDHPRTQIWFELFTIFTLLLSTHYLHYQKWSATRCNPRISGSIGAAMPFASVSGRICSTGASKERKLAFGRSGSDFGGGTCIGCLGCANICCSRNCCSWFASKITSYRLET